MLSRSWTKGTLISLHIIIWFRLTCCPVLKFTVLLLRNDTIILIDFVPFLQHVYNVWFPKVSWLADNHCYKNRAVCVSSGQRQLFSSKKWKLLFTMLMGGAPCNAWCDGTWSIADGFFPWWNDETNIAKACTWFMLTLNWSCNILALSSHILARFSILRATTSAYMHENMHTELQSPSKTPISRALFDHFRLILALGTWRTFSSA